jgi:hypothetical protein
MSLISHPEIRTQRSRWPAGGISGLKPNDRLFLIQNVPDVKVVALRQRD